MILGYWRCTRRWQGVYLPCRSPCVLSILPHRCLSLHICAFPRVLNRNLLYLHDFVKLIEARHVKNGSVGRASEAYTTSFLKKWLKNMMQQTNWMIELPLILKLHLVLKKYLVSLDKFILPLMPVLSLNAIEPGNDICFSFTNEIEMLEKTIKVYIHTFKEKIISCWVEGHEMAVEKTQRWLYSFQQC